MYLGKNKYKAVKAEADGIIFHSRAERDFYLVLKSLEKLNQLEILELQPKVYLTKSKILYKPDFLIKENGKNIYIDVKGVETPVFKLKKKLWKHYGIGCLRLVKKSGKNFKTTEEVFKESS